jgi:hypothetical protein
MCEETIWIVTYCETEPKMDKYYYMDIISFDNMDWILLIVEFMKTRDSLIVLKLRGSILQK